MKTLKLFTVLFFFLGGTLFSQPNCSAPTTGFTPINDLGTGISPETGLMGGLYPNGSNFLPSAHKLAGLQMASQIQCLDTNGNPDTTINGKIVWLSIGMSNTTQETQRFIQQANAFQGKNPNLILVDGAFGGQTASIISNPGVAGYTNYWNNVNTRLTNAGVTANQVQVIWLKQANQAGTVPVQSYHDNLVAHLKLITNELKTRFPHAKLCFMASRISARYATSTLNPEPYAYRQGWAVKQVIEDQINGDAQLSFSGSGANSPWLGWGIYMWSDGSNPQISNPNVFYDCSTDFANDGTHPSTAGAQKVGALLLNFFSTDSIATPWFLGTSCNSNATGIQEETFENSLIIYPNPSNKFLNIQLPDNITGPIKIEIYNQVGEIVYLALHDKQLISKLDISQLSAGIYFIRVSTVSQSVYNKKILVTR